MMVRQFVAWLLVVALGLYGQTTVTVQLLGSAHRHVSTAQNMGAGGPLGRVSDMFRDIREWRAGLYERFGVATTSHVHAHADGTRHTHTDGAPHGHAHATAEAAAHAHAHLNYQRHHHAQGDATVIAMDGSPDDPASPTTTTASVGGAALPPPTMVSEPIAATGTSADAPWPHMAAVRWSDASVIPLERPPRA